MGNTQTPNVTSTSNTTNVFAMANDTKITSIGMGTLPLNQKLTVPITVCKDSDMPRALLAVKSLTDQDCDVLFTKTGVTVYDEDGNILLHAPKDPSDPLWHIYPDPEQPPPENGCNLVINSALDANYAQLIHQTFGSPPTSSIIKAAGTGYFAQELPRATAALFRKNLQDTIATHAGHLDQIKMGLRSTKGPPGSPPPKQQIHHVVIERSDLSTLYSDQTGPFPLKSWGGVSLLMISTINGYVHIEGLHDRSGPSLAAAAKASYEFYATANPDIKVRQHVIDNESKQYLMKVITEHNAEPQLAPAYEHRTNKAEGAIKRVKNHIVSMLATADDDFDLGLWDHCLSQAEITLNSIHPCATNNKISAYEGLFGHPYPFSRHPMHIFGTKHASYEAPSARAAWGPHAVQGFYLGPSLEHYRCFKMYIPATKGIRIPATVGWTPKAIWTPGSSREELLHAATTDLTAALNLITKALHDRKDITAVNLAGQATKALTESITQYYPESTTTTPIINITPTPPTHTITITTTTTKPLQPPPGLPAPSEQRANIETTVPMRPYPHTRSSDNPDFTPAVQAVTIEPPPTSKGDDPEKAPPAMSKGELKSALNLDPTTGKPLSMRTALKGESSDTWEQARTTEFRKQLEQGCSVAIHQHDIPAARRKDITYCSDHPKEKLKTDQATGISYIEKRVRTTIGGDMLHYPGETAARVASIETFKIMLNSVISDKL